MITILFGKSNSQNYPMAIRQAKRSADNYTESDEGKFVIHKAIYSYENYVKAEKLWNTVGNWKSTEMYIQDELAVGIHFFEIRRVMECAKNRERSLLPNRYCEGHDEGKNEKYFACNQLNSVVRYPEITGRSYYREDTVWYHYGTFDEDFKTFTIDKEAIKTLLNNEADQKRISICPHFSIDRIDDLINTLPNNINLVDQEEYVVDKETTPPKLRTKAEYEALQDSKQPLSFNYKQDEEEEIAPVETNINFEDIGGLEEEIRRIRESVELPITHPELFEHYGITPYKGILLFGPPGTGKTLLAKAVANESKMNFFKVSGPEIFDKWFGESERKLRDIFETAKKQQPSIIFFDEIDAIGSKRTEDSTNSHYSKIVTQLLTLMDGMESRDQVIVMAATNRPNSLDPALRRPGRLDTEIYIGPPSEEGRKKILDVHTKKMPLDMSVNLTDISSTLHGYVGADITALCKEAALQSLRRQLLDGNLETKALNEMKVNLEDFKQAKKQIVPTAGREVLAYTPTVNWDHVIGCYRVKEELEKKVIKPWRSAHLYRNIRKTKGILFSGPSGTGKTYLAKALATELGMNVISLKGSDVLSKYQGDSAGNLKKYFEKARELAPAMIIIDEIDAIAPSRLKNKGGNDLVNELLSQMDGFDALTDVLVVGTTNYLDILDEAVLRPGRFDIHITVSIANLIEAKELVSYYLKKSGFEYDASLIDIIGRRVKTGAEAEHIVNQAAYEAIWRDELILTKHHFSYK
ncbi:AAA family ATPase [Bacillus sp. BA3]|uniref:AAA family ATPase n=1 Tax=Bacillus sp. BA3 TaxID=2057910 RepID=UPI000C328297|nr:AAA family ATPase [Bacillus sp. BA3]PKF89031.1 AAA family ATPase [Bacillus sp. BA3]